MQARKQALGQQLYAFFIHEGYVWDWATATALILINNLIPGYAVDPLTRFFTVSDPTLAYPLNSNSVPSSALYVLVFLVPAAVVTVVSVLYRSWVDWHHAALSVAEGYALTCGFKRWMNLVGVLRPNWLATLAEEGGDSGEVDDARMSYPSGHSAYMFFSMTIVTLYLVGKTRLLSQPSQLLFLKASLALAPMVLATFVALTRIADYKHAPADVNAGCFIGIVCGAYSYYLNYDHPFCDKCHAPKRRTAPYAPVFGAGRSSEADSQQL